MIFLHNLLRWVLLLLLVFSVLRSFRGWQSKKPFAPGDGKVWLFTMIIAHTSLVIGLYLLLFGIHGILSSDLPAGVSVMKDKYYRFFWVEHPFAMIVSILLITLGRGMAKKQVSDTVKYRRAFWFFFIALLLILASIPWPFREIVGRPWI